MICNSLFVLALLNSLFRAQHLKQRPSISQPLPPQRARPAEGETEEVAWGAVRVLQKSDTNLSHREFGASPSRAMVSWSSKREYTQLTDTAPWFLEQF